MYLYIFRVDGGKIPELGTGHIYRCINIYKYLISKKVNKKKILFITKTTGKYLIAKKILDNNKIKYQTINSKIKDFSKEEYKYLQKFNSKVIIIDRLGEINFKFIKNIKEKFNKIVGIDTFIKNPKKIDLLINPLNNKFKFSKKLNNFRNNVLPSINQKNKKIGKNKIKKIFIFFGGYDYKKIQKKILNIKLKNIKILIPSSKEDFYKLMIKSNIVICSGGLTVFDSLYLNKITIAIPQYYHQLKNLKVLEKNGVIYLCQISKKLKNKITKTIENILKLNYSDLERIQKKQKKIISKKSQMLVLKKIYDLQ